MKKFVRFNPFIGQLIDYYDDAELYYKTSLSTYLAHHNIQIGNIDSEFYQMYGVDEELYFRIIMGFKE